MWKLRDAPRRTYIARMTKKRKATKSDLTKKPKATPLPVVSTGFWLFKSEPESYSIRQFAKDEKTLWTGVRNYQARNFMMTSMQPGDEFLFYHSNAEPPSVVGVGRIVRVNLPDPSALDAKSEYHDAKASLDHPIWFCAEVAYKETFSRPISLEELRSVPALKDMALLRPGQRLSIQPVTSLEFTTISQLARRSR